jgi:hypothetical protein
MRWLLGFLVSSYFSLSQPRVADPSARPIRMASLSVALRWMLLGFRLDAQLPSSTVRVEPLTWLNVSTMVSRSRSLK